MSARNARRLAAKQKHAEARKRNEENFRILAIRDFLIATASWNLAHRLRLAWQVIVKKYKIKKGGEKNVHSTKAKR